MFDITLGNVHQGPTGAGVSLSTVGIPQGSRAGPGTRGHLSLSQELQPGASANPSPSHLPEQGNRNSLTLFIIEVRTPNSHLKILISVSKGG